MKASEIHEIMDLAKRVRDQKRTFTPCFVSAPGLGKSEIVQQWAKKHNYQLVDIRAALLEAPDLIGYPTIVTGENGRQITTHATPDLWPSNGKGVLFIDEVNRGTTSVMNCFMQLLTDRKIKDYTLPEEWLIVAAINPENEMNDVNSMDSALKDRLEFFEVEYNKKVHVDYMLETKYDDTVRMFVESGAWTYSKPEEISNVAGAKYLSPRTFSKLNNIIQAGVPKLMELEIYNNTLGELMGKAFYQFKNNEQPVTFEELNRNLKESINRLKSFCDPKNYKTGHVSITFRSLLENQKEVNDELLYQVSLAVGAEQAVSFIRELEFARNSTDIFGRLVNTYPDLGKHFKQLKKV